MASSDQRPSPAQVGELARPKNGIRPFLTLEQIAEIQAEIEAEQRREDLDEHPWKRTLLPYCQELALLPIGGNKIPVDLETGRHLRGWQMLSYGIEELTQPNGWLQALAYRPGPESGHIAGIDIDGNTALAWLLERGARPENAGWRTQRDEGRLKVHFRIPEKLRDLLPLGKRVLHIKPKGPNGEPAEQIEFFYGSGQCVIAGRHPSGDIYRSEGNPETVTEPNEAWTQALLELVAKSKKAKTEHGQEPAERWQSGPGSPCPVCGRSTTSACTVWLGDNGDGTTRRGVNCHHGSTFCPPRTRDMGSFGGELPLEKGDEVEIDGVTWAFVREGANSLIGPFSVFVENRPMPRADEKKAELKDTEGEKKLTYGQLIEAMLEATIEGKSDDLMELRAEAIQRFRRTDAQIEAALFKRHTELETGCIRRAAPKPLDLSKISGVDWLVPGFLPANDLALLYGEAGTGKTTAALVLARAVLQGTGVLDHETPAAMGKVLFIASDSGPQPLVAAMQDLGMADMPEVQLGDQQRFFVWAADQANGSTAWSADLRGCIELLKFVRKNQIALVVMDSCKAICRGTEVDYALNHSVTALLTYLKEVVAPHTSLLLLNHDGTARNATAGAKSWKEIPSVVHQLGIEELNGQMVHERRLWQLRKSRLGPLREFRYQLSDGEPVLCEGEETFGNCHDLLVEVLKRAYANGEEELRRKELITRVQLLAKVAEKTIDNALVAANRAKHPEICRARHGSYKLAPRIAQSLKGSISNGKEFDQNPVPDFSLSISRPFPVGKFGTSETPGQELPANFPAGEDGKSISASHTNGSREIPPDTHGLPNQDRHSRPLVPGDRVQVRTVSGSWNSGWEVLAPPHNTTSWVQVRDLLRPSHVPCFPKEDLRLDRSIPSSPSSTNCE